MFRPTRRTALRGAALLAASLPALARAPLARAQGEGPAWPTRPVRLVVPFTAAGTTDILARILTERLSNRLGQNFVVDNRPGAGGNIGADLVAKAEPDGHTLLMTTIGTGAINYALYRNMPFRPADLVAVSNMATVPNVIMVASEVPAYSLPELVALAKKRPGELTFGSSGNGTSLHLTGEMLMAATGIELIHVPFRGSAPMLTELMAGRIDMAVDNLPSSLNHIREGRMRAIALTSPRRSPALPEVPTTTEAGFPGVQAEAWFGVQAPAKLPRPILARLSGEIQEIVRDPATRAKIEEQGAEPVGDTPEEFESFIRAEIAKWAGVVQQAHVTID